MLRAARVQTSRSLQKWRGSEARFCSVISKPSPDEQDPETLVKWANNVLGTPPATTLEQDNAREFWKESMTACRQVSPHLGGKVSLSSWSPFRLLAGPSKSRRAPWIATGWYSIYCTTLSAPFMYAHWEKSQVIDTQAGVFFNKVVEYLFLHNNMFVGVTGALATALFLMTSFRLNRCVGRWWEGAGLVGTLSSKTRNLCMTSQAALKSKPEAMEIGCLAYAHARSMEYHLRQSPDEKYVELLKNMLSPAEIQACLNSPLRPIWLVHHINLKCADAYDAGRSKHVRLYYGLVSDTEELVRLTQCLIRVSAVPEPWNYINHSRLTAQLWLALLPLTLMPTLMFATPAFCSMVGYVVYKLDDVCIELANPFGFDKADLPFCMQNDQLQLQVLDMLHTYARHHAKLKDTP